jgi:hypothetical protein
VSKKKHTVLVLADMQAPFEHPDYLNFTKTVYRKYGCDLVVNVGDEADQHTLGSFDPDPDGMSGGDELTATREHLKPFYKAFPKVFVCESNHTARIFRKAFRHGIPRGYLKDYRDFLGAPQGWQWAEKWVIDGVVYQHGEGYSGAQGTIKAAHDNMACTVMGHLHSEAGLQTWANSKILIWGLNVGSGIDKDLYAFHYGKKLRKKPILSCGVVDKGQPVLVYMELNARGRWTGRV